MLRRVMLNPTRFIDDALVYAQQDAMFHLNMRYAVITLKLLS